MDQGSTRKCSAVQNIAPTVTKFCVMWEGLSLPHDTKFGNCRDEIADRRVIFIWALIQGSSWSGLIKVGPGACELLLIHGDAPYLTFIQVKFEFGATISIDARQVRIIITMILVILGSVITKWQLPLTLQLFNMRGKTSMYRLVVLHDHLQTCWNKRDKHHIIIDCIECKAYKQLNFISPFNTAWRFCP